MLMELIVCLVELCGEEMGGRQKDSTCYRQYGNVCVCNTPEFDRPEVVDGPVQ